MTTAMNGFKKITIEVTIVKADGTLVPLGIIAETKKNILKKDE